jgi:outer membrane protein OmpA-like peptidoglycan-associated protein
MKCRIVVTVAAFIVLTSAGLFAQQGAASPAEAAFWTAHWAQPEAILFGADEEAFNQNVQAVMFPWDASNDPSNPATLDADVQWLKDHPNARFYIDGYASSRGELIYNLVLSQQRADWVKQTLISKGIPENRIALAVGWGQLYPVCPELTDECWTKNRLVRFVYAPN